MPLADSNAIRRQAGSLRARFAGPALGAFPTLVARITRRIGLQQELLAVARQYRQRCRDIGHRHIVIAFVVLDEPAEQFDFRCRERSGDGIAELRHSLGIDIVDRRQRLLGKPGTGGLLDGLE